MNHKNRLHVINSEENINSPSPPLPSRIKTTREEVQALFESRWKKNPSQFDPLCDCMGRERIARTRELLAGHLRTESAKAVDLGCGRGDVSRILKELGFKVTAVDISKNGLEIFREKGSEGILLIQDLVPHTKLDDGIFGLVVSTDLIGYLPKREHRLYFSELARLCEKDGLILCSTPIDYNSEDALDIFKELAETELEILAWKLSYHKYYLKLLDIFKAPEKFARAGYDASYRDKAISKRSFFLKFWFKLNSYPLTGGFWNLFRHISNPIHKAIRQSKCTLLFLETLCRTLSPESGISHAIMIGKRRRLIEADPPESPPIEMKQKRRVWE